jgi:hypothetical protein
VEALAEQTTNSILPLSQIDVLNDPHRMNWRGVIASSNFFMTVYWIGPYNSCSTV